MLRLLGLCIAVLVLTLPLWLDSAHRTVELGDLSPDTARVVEAASDHNPGSTSGAVHCALHCAPQMLFPALLLCALLLPLMSSPVPAYARFHPRLGSAPPLPPPRTR